MSGFTLLWGKILDSSIWVKESQATRLVWVALLAMKDSLGVVQASHIGLADRAKVSPGECEAALQVLLSADPDDTSGIEGGRRLRVVPGGWQVINHDLYRFSTEAKREFWRLEKAKQRAVNDARERVKRKKKRKPSDLPGEQAYVAASQNGATVEQLDRIVTKNLP